MSIYEDYLPTIEEEETQEEKEEAKKECFCCYNSGINCSMWVDPKLERLNCPRCGWNPEEEYRRKKVIAKLIDRGEWVPHLYSLEHYG